MTLCTQHNQISFVMRMLRTSEASKRYLVMNMDTLTSALFALSTRLFQSLSTLSLPPSAVSTAASNAARPSRVSLSMNILGLPSAHTRCAAKRLPTMKVRRGSTNRISAPFACPGDMPTSSRKRLPLSMLISAWLRAELVGVASAQRPALFARWFLPGRTPPMREVARRRAELRLRPAVIRRKVRPAISALLRQGSMLHRQIIGEYCEIVEDYCRIAARRCEEAFASQALFRQEQPA